LQKVWLWCKENVSACDRRKPNGCNQTMTLIEDTMYSGHVEVASLVYILV